MVHFFHETTWSGVPYRGRMIEDRMAEALAAEPYAHHATHTSRDGHLRERGVAAPVEACREMKKHIASIPTCQAHSRW